MKDIYSEFFKMIIENEVHFDMESKYLELLKEIAYEGTIEKLTDTLHIYLNNLSNRDYQKFDEKYVKIICYAIAVSFNSDYYIKSELEVNRNYTDLLILAKNPEYYSILIEFKYLKKEDKDKLSEKQKEAREQLETYSEHEWIRDIQKLKKYTMVAVVDDIYVEEI